MAFVTSMDKIESWEETLANDCEHEVGAADEAVSECYVETTVVNLVQLLHFIVSLEVVQEDEGWAVLVDLLIFVHIGDYDVLEHNG